MGSGFYTKFIPTCATGCGPCTDPAARSYSFFLFVFLFSPNLRLVNCCALKYDLALLAVGILSSCYSSCSLSLCTAYLCTSMCLKVMWEAMMSVFIAPRSKNKFLLTIPYTSSVSKSVPVKVSYTELPSSTGSVVWTESAAYVIRF
jgi:hypothetical protein